MSKYNPDNDFLRGLKAYRHSDQTSRRRNPIDSQKYINRESNDIGRNTPGNIPAFKPKVTGYRKLPSGIRYTAATVALILAVALGTYSYSRAPVSEASDLMKPTDMLSDTLSKDSFEGWRSDYVEAMKKVKRVLATNFSNKYNVYDGNLTEDEIIFVSQNNQANNGLSNLAIQFHLNKERRNKEYISKEASYTFGSDRLRVFLGSTKNKQKISRYTNKIRSRPRKSLSGN